MPKKPLYPHIPKGRLTPSALQDTEANKFLADIKKSIPDEEMATKEYSDMANVAERLGYYGLATTLRGMSGDEARHGRLLKGMLEELDKEKEKA